MPNQGTVFIAIDVNERGRVTACTIVRSSGSAELDAVTCRIAAGRARYTPARNAKGRKVPDTIESAMDWRLH